jgi:hypothetical protein
MQLENAFIASGLPKMYRTTYPETARFSKSLYIKVSENLF